MFLSEFKVISTVVLIRTSLILITAKISHESGETLVLTPVMSLPTTMCSCFPPHTAQWKGIIDGRTLLPEFSLAKHDDLFSLLEKYVMDKVLVISNM